MARIPFGIAGLDSRIGGGPPAGSVVLLAGESGAGAREFLYTSAVMNGLAETDPELFSLHYGDRPGAADAPDSIHYLSFTADAETLSTEISYTMDDGLVEAGLEPIAFEDLSAEYFQLSPVPREWYGPAHRDITDLGQDADRQGVLTATANYLDEHASGSLVLIDSLSDLIAARGRHHTIRDLVLTLKGLRRIAREWNSLILLLLTKDAVTDEELGSLMTAVDGTLQFEWETGGNERVRTMYVPEFRGVLSQLEAEDIIRFETEIHDAGFDVSNVRKIR
ncbi:RecA-superfamily ATPase [Halodesulfurarchaeum formicicum]|uniref:RecA-superfamily ATPase n=1 Tax=Halodesulfurarchaeum formicicum TaxID=1873524 RepID=A0A1D8S2S6_9EURY|nr:HTR-like protein [Halodesulfurarchaeum formicicum]AOW79643.1 RecA-superfamily ATPase [Halodesulfurarchaeum formicicum]